MALNENIHAVIEEAVAAIMNEQTFDAYQALDLLSDKDLRLLAAEGLTMWANRVMSEE